MALIKRMEGFHGTKQPRQNVVNQLSYCKKNSQMKFIVYGNWHKHHYMAFKRTQPTTQFALIISVFNFSILCELTASKEMFNFHIRRI